MSSKELRCEIKQPCDNAIVLGEGWFQCRFPEGRGKVVYQTEDLACPSNNPEVRDTLRNKCSETVSGQMSSARSPKRLPGAIISQGSLDESRSPEDIFIEKEEIPDDSIGY